MTHKLYSDALAKALQDEMEKRSPRARLYVLHKPKLVDIPEEHRGLIYRNIDEGPTESVTVRALISEAQHEGARVSVDKQAAELAWEASGYMAFILIALAAAVGWAGWWPLSAALCAFTILLRQRAHVQLTTATAREMRNIVIQRALDRRLQAAKAMAMATDYEEAELARMVHDDAMEHWRSLQQDGDT